MVGVVRIDGEYIVSAGVGGVGTKFGQVVLAPMGMSMEAVQGCTARNFTGTLCLTEALRHRVASLMTDSLGCRS